MDDEERRYQQAKERVQEIKGFYVHLMIYLIVNAGIFLVNILVTPKHLWFYWPILGWGVGILAHGVGVFGLGPFFGHEWEERKIKQIMDKSRR